jgi:D-alanyl-lipoteichoic acid acyltransferase DltB (MBOAT superfamily)
MGSSEHINEPSVSIPHSEFTDKLRNYSFSRKLMLHGVIVLYIIYGLFIGPLHISHYKALKDKMTRKQ